MLYRIHVDIAVLVCADPESREPIVLAERQAHEFIRALLEDAGSPTHIADAEVRGARLSSIVIPERSPDVR